MSLNFIDLFSGCGGFSYGMEMSGHRCLLGVDSDKNAIKTFKLNHRNAEVFCGDIKKLTQSNLEKLLNGKLVDMVIGGPPCQGFSTIGKGKVEDSRNTLFKEFIRIVKITNPRIIVLENVTGLLANKNKKILKQILKSFKDIGYQIEARVLSSEEYGVPEIRRRTNMIGSKNCSAPIFPEISHGLRGRDGLRTVKYALKNLKSSDKKIYNHDINMAQLTKQIDLERLKYIPDGKSIRYEKDEQEYLPKELYFEIDWENLKEGRFRQARLRRLDSSLPSPTILTSKIYYYHPFEHRHITPREAASCQSFPNDFIFTGSLTSQFKQIGNAVPPLLAMAIGNSIKKMITGKSTRAKQRIY